MAKQIIITEYAYQDIIEIETYYLEISQKLKNRFEKELLESIEQLSIYPSSYQVYKIFYRSINLTIFPFKIYYKETKDTVWIVAIIHSSRSDTFRESKFR